MFFRGGGDFFRLARVHQVSGAFGDQRVERDAVNNVERVEHIAFGLGHFLALRVTDQAMHIHFMERHFVGEVQGHHHHARHPEKDDVKAGDQHG